ncbi:6-pyruvoyl tetrahydrobiopterin synthase-like [Haliotis rubra]|uniref:6-pyruvoyl tetrahydrobiopterin synthase-like n=1 Tax=Haliotis rubra TaxID=36100 RepID=UPI001EE51C9B|nr:6-pyruvoyl tetrahydrobiopterin synthase-like [Haliotis rubra]
MEPTKDRIVYISRTDIFCAGHRLFSKDLTEEENVKIFGKCSSVNGHGHNYKVRVTLRGPVHPVTGMVFDSALLGSLMTECIMDVLDHKNINMDVPDFWDTVTTTENIVMFIWNQLKRKIPADLLYEVQVQASERNTVSYRGRTRLRSHS